MIPPELNDMKNYVINNAGSHGLNGISFGGIGPGSSNAYGYHNTRNRHLAGLTIYGANDYSVQLNLDKQGNGDYFSALDLTGTGPTRVMTARLRDAVNSGDPRLSAVREFYGSLDNNVVFGRHHSSETGPWSSAASDSSHLWHVHISFFRKYNNDRSKLRDVANVLLGIPGSGSQEDALATISGTEAQVLKKIGKAVSEHGIPRASDGQLAQLGALLKWANEWSRQNRDRSNDINQDVNDLKTAVAALTTTLNEIKAKLEES